MWTLKWGAKSGPRFGVRRIVFSFRGPQNGVQILGPILGSTLPVFFSAAWRPKRSSRSRMWAGSFTSQAHCRNCARTCGYQDNEPAHKHSIQNVNFSGVTSRKIMGNVDPKMGCKIWTPFWGPPNCFFFSRAPKRGPDFRPHFGVHIARFFFGSMTPKKVIPE